MDTLIDVANRILGLIRRGWVFLRALFDRLVAAIYGPTGQQLQPQQPAAPETSAPARAPEPPTIPLDPQGTDNETALARMLASETSSDSAKVVIGWITIQRARKTSLYQFLTKGQGYGAQDRRPEGKGIFYASTAKNPTAADRKIARDLLAGAVKPSGAIIAHKPGAWVERGQGTSDESILSKQAAWKEGIYGRVEGTAWVLYSSDTKPIAAVSGQTAAQALDALPAVPGIETADQRLAA